MSKRYVTSITTKVFSVVLFVSACGSGGAASEQAENEDYSGEITSSAQDEIVKEEDQSFEDGQINTPITLKQQQNPKLPEPEIELPPLPYDKTQLPTVMKLDEMIMDVEKLGFYYNLVNEELQVLKQKTGIPMYGTHEDIAKSVIGAISAIDHFNSYALFIAEESMKNFKSKYEDDSDFSSKYRDTYYAVETEIAGGSFDDGSLIIKDATKRREVTSHFYNNYQSARYSKVDDIQMLIDDSKGESQKLINSVVGLAQVDMMVADYKKGKELTDLLNKTINNLKIVLPLDPKNETVLSTMASVNDKKKKRIEEIKTALEEYRFPERYNEGNAPSNSSELENRMKSFLGKSKRTSDKNYEVLNIKVAGPWINIYNALTGAHMYSQIDFYVAVPSLGEGEEGLVDILYVTGKTSGPHQNAFGTYSVGGMGQMKKSNL